MCSVCKLNKQGDNKQPFHTPLSILNQSVIPYKVLAVACWPAYMFLRRQVRWSGITISWRIFQIFVIHTITDFSVVSETGRYFSGIALIQWMLATWSPSCSCLNIWKFSVHVVLKPSLGDFEHNLTSMGNEFNCLVVWAFFSTLLLGNWDEDQLFPVPWPLPSFSKLLTYWVQHFNSYLGWS